MSKLSAQPSDAYLDVVNEANIGPDGIVVVGTTAVGSGAMTAMGPLGGVAIGSVATGLDIPSVPPSIVSDLDENSHTAFMSGLAAVGHVGIPITFTNPPRITALAVGLFTGNPSPLTINTLLTDLTEPTYTGYARVPVTPGMLRRNIAGDFLDSLSSAAFQPLDAVGLPQTATGVFLVGTIDGVVKLLVSEFLDVPFVFTASTSGIDVEVMLAVRNLLNFGGICSTC